MADKPVIGFIGVGLMGHGMAKNIAEKGYELYVMAHRNRAPVDVDLTRVRALDAGQDLHQRALARAVGAQQRVDLARAHPEVHRTQRHHRAVGLGDLGCLKEMGLTHGCDNFVVAYSPTNIR